MYVNEVSEKHKVMSYFLSLTKKRYCLKTVITVSIFILLMLKYIIRYTFSWKKLLMKNLKLLYSFLKLFHRLVRNGLSLVWLWIHNALLLSNRSDHCEIQTVWFYCYDICRILPVLYSKFSVVVISLSSTKQ